MKAIHDSIQALQQISNFCECSSESSNAPFMQFQNKYFAQAAPLKYYTSHADCSKIATRSSIARPRRSRNSCQYMVRKHAALLASLTFASLLRPQKA